MNNILLLVIYSDGMWDGLEEIGISSIAACLREAGENVCIMAKRGEDIVYEDIVEFQPDFIGFVVYEKSKDLVYKVAQTIKGLLPSCHLIAGGIYPTYKQKQMLEECEYFDYLLTGEGEYSFVHLMQALKGEKKMEQVGGLIYRDDVGAIYTNSQPGLLMDLDMLPFPARDILVGNQLKVAQISGSRGCTGRCDFCSSQLFRKKWIGRNPPNICDEIDYIHKKFNIHIFNFIDCSFEDPGVNYERVYAIADEIVRRELVISFMANFRPMFYRKADDALMFRLKEAGLICGFIGIESGNNQDLILYNKRATVDDNIRTLQFFKQHDINVQPGFINFNPFSTMDTLEDNFNLLNQNLLLNNIGLIANRYRMYPGTRLSAHVEEAGLLIENTDNFENAYQFLDRRVGYVCDYLEQIMSPQNTLSPILASIENYASMFRLVVAHYNNVYMKRNCENAADMIDSYRKEADAVLEGLHNTIAQWYSDLLALAQHGWQASKAAAITDKYLAADSLSEAVNLLDRLRNRLHKNLISKYPNYSSYIVSSF